jgi:branched-chain amino acid transport system permease protein
VFVGCLGFAVLLPNLVDTVWQGILLQIAINACAALGMTLIFGFAGQLAVAQAVFFACGAYSVALLTSKTSISGWWALPIGIAAAGLLALAFHPVLRLQSVYLAMATLALNIAMIAILTQTAFFGAAIGIVNVKPLVFFGRDLFQPRDLYYFALASFSVLFVLAYRLITSPVGLMLAALRHDERAASLSGIHTPRLKTKVFAVSAMFGAVGGFWFTSYLFLAQPESFGIVPSFLFLIMVVIGGMRSLPGAVLGAAFIVVIPQLMPSLPRQQQFVFACTFLLVAMFAPQGLAGLVGQLWRFVRDRATGRAAGPQPEGAK